MATSVDTRPFYDGASDSRSLGSELVVALRDAIITGEIPQGSKLSETKLAQQYKVSRGPLREAIRRLEGMNLVHSRPQLGSRVVEINENLINHIYHAREALECKAIALAARHMSSQEIDQLNRVMDNQSRHLKQHTGDYLQAESDYEFHELIIRGSKNPVLINLLLEEIYSLIKMIRYQNDWAKSRSTAPVVEHRHMMYAIEQRDSVLAEISLRQHITRARKNIQERIRKNKTAEADNRS
jgi:DNA-binding GntR family transcriptional regulator